MPGGSASCGQGRHASGVCALPWDCMAFARFGSQSGSSCPLPSKALLEMRAHVCQKVPECPPHHFTAAGLTLTRVHSTIPGPWRAEWAQGGSLEEERPKAGGVASVGSGDLGAHLGGSYRA